MTRIVWRWTTGISLTGGVLVAAALTGATETAVARADEAVPDIGASSAGTLVDLAANSVAPIVTANPLDVLDDATANLTEANQVLSQAPSDIAGLMLQPNIQNIALSELALLYTAEGSLDSYDHGAFADLLNPWFTVVDQGWDQGTEALLNADQALETALTAGTGVDDAVVGIFAANFGLAGDMVNDLPIEFVAGFTDPALFANLI